MRQRKSKVSRADRGLPAALSPSDSPTRRFVAALLVVQPLVMMPLLFLVPSHPDHPDAPRWPTVVFFGGFSFLLMSLGMYHGRTPGSTNAPTAAVMDNKTR